MPELAAGNGSVVVLLTIGRHCRPIHIDAAHASADRVFSTVSHGPRLGLQLTPGYSDFALLKGGLMRGDGCHRCG